VVAASVLGVAVTTLAQSPWTGEGPVVWRLGGGVQTLVVADPLDDDPKREAVEFGVNRAAVDLRARLYGAAQLRVHAMGRAWDGGPYSVDIADAEVQISFHSLFNLRGGRFKKRLTDVFTPSWAQYRFIDMPGYYRYAAGTLGLAGRGQGVLVYGRSSTAPRPLLQYHVGFYDGLEAARTLADGSHRTDDGVQFLARVDVSPLNSLRLGLAATHLHGTTLHTPVSGQPGVFAQTEERLGAYVFSIHWDYRGVTWEGEYLGHVTMPTRGSSVTGGGFRSDLLYRFPLFSGELQPGIRCARHHPDFDQSENYSQEATGVVNWWWKGTAARLGLEFGWSERHPGSKDAIQVMLQAAVFVE